MYNIIFFDLDDTLLDFTESEKISLVHIHQQYYSNVQYDEFLSAYTDINTALWSRVGSLEHPLTSGEVKFLRFQQLNERFNITVSSEIIAKSYEDLLVDNANWYPGVKHAIEFLYNMEIVLGIITNGPVIQQTKKFYKHQLGLWFDCYTVSDAVGYAKPQKEIFQCAINALIHNKKTTIEKAVSSKILMVGDSLSHDGKGAYACGFDFCHVDKEASDNKEISYVTFTLSSVTELPLFLGYQKEFKEYLSHREMAVI